MFFLSKEAMSSNTITNYNKINLQSYEYALFIGQIFDLRIEFDFIASAFRDCFENGFVFTIVNKSKAI